MEAATVKFCRNGLHKMTPDNIERRQGKNRCIACIVARSREKYDKHADYLPPTTQPFLAGYKEPLKKVEDGFGYYGTLAFDMETQQYTQCHYCGNFYRRLGRHVVHAHGISARQYKEELGLAVGMSLVAPNSKTDRHYIWESYSADERQKIMDNLKKGQGHATKGQRLSLYHRNLKGRCPDQLLDKIRLLMEKQHSVPTRREFALEYGEGDLHAIYIVHGKWSTALKRVMNSPEMHTEESLSELLRDFRVRFGREPLSTDALDGLLPSNEVFRSVFGSFTKAKEVALGLPTKTLQEVSL